MQRDDLFQNFQLLVEQPVLLVFGPVLSLFTKFPQLRVLFKHQFVNPGEVAPHLQIAQISFGKSRQRRFDRIDPEPSLQIHFVITTVGTNHILHARHEEVVQHIVDIGFAESVGGIPRNVEMPVAACLISILLQLQQQAGNEIDGAVKLGHLLEMQRHAVVILGSVQADPGHQRLAADVVRIIRLVLMPQKSKCHRLHYECLDSIGRSSQLSAVSFQLQEKRL